MEIDGRIYRYLGRDNLGLHRVRVYQRNMSAEHIGDCCVDYSVLERLDCPGGCMNRLFEVALVDADNVEDIYPIAALEHNVRRVVDVDAEFSAMLGKKISFRGKALNRLEIEGEVDIEEDEIGTYYFYKGKNVAKVFKGKCFYGEMSQDRFEDIYGFELDRILDNFDKLRKENDKPSQPISRSVQRRAISLPIIVSKMSH